MGFRRFSGGISRPSTSSSSSSSTKSVSTQQVQAQENGYHVQEENQQQQFSSQSGQMPGSQNARYSAFQAVNNNNLVSNVGQTSNGPISSLSQVQVQLSQRIRGLEVENRRIMSDQGRLIAESNKRLEMHLNEIRMLKEEVKSLRAANDQQNRDYCRRLAEEKKKWQQELERFGNYTNQLMKQELKTYQCRMSQLDAKNNGLVAENEELKRLCLYLDEQRQAILASIGAGSQEEAIALKEGESNVESKKHGGLEVAEGELSEDAGCGSSASSSAAEPDDLQLGSNADGMMASMMRFSSSRNQQREKTLRTIADQMTASMTKEEDVEENRDEALINALSANKEPQRAPSVKGQRVFDYIQSLENRIRQLEQGQGRLISRTNSARAFSFSPVMSDCFEEECSESAQTVREVQLAKKEELNCDNVGQKPVFSPQFPSSNRPSVQVLSDVAARRRMPFGLSGVQEQPMMMSTSGTTTMTSSGTTYCSSSEEEGEDSSATTILVMGDDSMDGSLVLFNHLEVRPLGTIQEEELEELAVEVGRQQLLDSSPLQEPFVRKRAALTNGNGPVCEREEEEAMETGSNRISSSSSTGSAFSSTKSYATGSGFDAESDEFLLDLPPKMPLISESNRFSICSGTSDMSLTSNSSSKSSKTDWNNLKQQSPRPERRKEVVSAVNRPMTTRIAQKPTLTTQVPASQINPIAFPSLPLFRCPTIHLSAELQTSTPSPQTIMTQNHFSSTNFWDM